MRAPDEEQIQKRWMYAALIVGIAGMAMPSLMLYLMFLW